MSTILYRICYNVSMLIWLRGSVIMLIILRRKANDATNIILQIIMIIVVCSNTNTAIDWYVK